MAKAGSSSLARAGFFLEEAGLHRLSRLPSVTPALQSRLSRYATLRYASLRYATLRFAIASLRYATLRYATLRFAIATLRFASLRYAAPRYATLRYATLRCSASLRFASLRYASLPPRAGKRRPERQGAATGAARPVAGRASGEREQRTLEERKAGENNQWRKSSLLL